VVVLGRKRLGWVHFAEFFYASVTARDNGSAGFFPLPPGFPYYRQVVKFIFIVWHYCFSMVLLFL
jgi:hypothetical protein